MRFKNSSCNLQPAASKPADVEIGMRRKVSWSPSDTGVATLLGTVTYLQVPDAHKWLSQQKVDDPIALCLWWEHASAHWVYLANVWEMDSQLGSSHLPRSSRSFNFQHSPSFHQKPMACTNKTHICLTSCWNLPIVQLATLKRTLVKLWFIVNVNRPHVFICGYKIFTNGLII